MILLRYRIINGCVEWFKIKTDHYIAPVIHGLPRIGPCAKAAAVAAPIALGAVGGWHVAHHGWSAGWWPAPYELAAGGFPGPVSAAPPLLPSGRPMVGAAGIGPQTWGFVDAWPTTGSESLPPSSITWTAPPSPLAPTVPPVTVAPPVPEVPVHVPEPASWVLLAGAVALVVAGRRWAA